MRFGVLAAGALILAAFAVPSVGAEHCDTKIHLFGRSHLAPVPPPPYTRSTHGMCHDYAAGPVDAHTLPPQTDQLLVRVNGVLGGGVTVLYAALHGLGFEGQSYPLHRTSHVGGGQTYQMTEWVSFPNGTRAGDITVTVNYPTGAMSVTYRVPV